MSFVWSLRKWWDNINFIILSGGFGLPAYRGLELTLSSAPLIIDGSPGTNFISCFPRGYWENAGKKGILGIWSSCFEFWENQKLVLILHFWPLMDLSWKFHFLFSVCLLGKWLGQKEILEIWSSVLGFHSIENYSQLGLLWLLG